MQKSESIKEITQAIIKVMMAIDGIEKNLTVGTGSQSYKGVSDKDVKNTIGKEMILAGLCIMPTGINANVKVERWTENSQYGEKQKQSVLTEVSTTYLLSHISGEFIELVGYGHGIDSQDKSAGKATTYALKNTLLYTFMVATGSIDDTDNTHSDTMPVVKQTPVQAADENKAWLNTDMPEFTSAVEKIKAGKSSIFALKNYFKISKQVEQKIIDAVSQ